MSSYNTIHDGTSLRLRHADPIKDVIEPSAFSREPYLRQLNAAEQDRNATDTRTGSERPIDGLPTKLMDRMNWEHISSSQSAAEIVAVNANELSIFPQMRPESTGLPLATVREDVVGEFDRQHPEQHQAFLLHSLLSPAECGYLINAALPLMESLDAHFVQNYRISDRAMFRSPAVADEIFKRILPHLKPEDYKNRIPLCFRQDGIWLPFGCNECLKIVRYSPGGHFAGHRDAPWIPSEDQASIFTVIIFLNEEFLRGTTQLYGAANRMIGYRTMSAAIRVHVVPTTGSALLFNHDMWHSGMPVAAGAKWILRTELIFQRVASHYVDRYLHLDDKSFAECSALYDESLRKLREGDRAGFAETYQQVIVMQKEAAETALLERAKSERLLSALNDDVLGVILEFLDDRSLRDVLSLSKATFYAASQSSVWEFKTQARFPFAAAQATRIVLRDAAALCGAAVDGELTTLHSAIDWKRVYVQNCDAQKRFTPAVLAPLADCFIFAVSGNAPGWSPPEQCYRNSVECALQPACSRVSVRCLTTTFQPISGRNVFHMNIPLTMRYVSAEGRSLANSVRAVDESGNVKWELLGHYAPRTIDCTKFPLVVVGHLMWFVGSRDDVKETLARMQRDVFLVLRTPAVVILHPALCLVANTLAKSGDLTKLQFTAEAGDVCAEAEGPLELVVMFGLPGVNVVVATVNTKTFTVLETVLVDWCLSGKLEEFVEAAAIKYDSCIRGVSLFNVTLPRDETSMMNLAHASQLVQHRLGSAMKHFLPSATLAATNDCATAVAALVEGAHIIASSHTFRDFCIFRP